MNNEQLFKLIKENITGWMVFEKLEWFRKIYEEIQPKVAVESGVFYGMSAITQGLIIKELGLDCQLYAIDAWSKEASTEGSNSEANNEWWSNLNYEEIYLSFLHSIRKFELEGIVIPIRAKSVDAINVLPKHIDCLHLDSNHSFEVVSKEIELYAPRVHGYIVADDNRWVEMRGAAEGLLNYGFTKVHQHDKDGQSFGVFKK